MVVALRQKPHGNHSVTPPIEFAALTGGANAGGSSTTLGIISDTHGLLRPEALTALTGCDGVIHAGDLGRLEVYEALCRLAPTVAIRGNVDRGPWAQKFPETLALSVAGVHIYVLHDLNVLTFDPMAEKVDLVISGHSHRPVFEERAGILYVNPGSAGPRRFSLPVTLARLKISTVECWVELIDVLKGTVVESLFVPRRVVSAQLPVRGSESI